jgi:hypothetical protein
MNHLAPRHVSKLTPDPTTAARADPGAHACWRAAHLIAHMPTIKIHQPAGACARITPAPIFADPAV